MGEQKHVENPVEETPKVKEECAVGAVKKQYHEAIYFL